MLPTIIKAKINGIKLRKFVYVAGVSIICWAFNNSLKIPKYGKIVHTISFNTPNIKLATNGISATALYKVFLYFFNIYTAETNENTKNTILLPVSKLFTVEVSPNETLSIKPKDLNSI